MYTYRNITAACFVAVLLIALAATAAAARPSPGASIVEPAPAASPAVQTAAFASPVRLPLLFNGAARPALPYSLVPGSSTCDPDARVDKWVLLTTSTDLQCTGIMFRQN